ncbi:hypothetical protein OH779_24765 [Actinacidiphila glaucinigra]|uniref:hypothetical protein n=1 Tax=Actinacidiphila glaucinigra TaxID=235986 RepID=UPI003869DA6D
MTTITAAAGAPSGLGPDDLVPAHAPRMLLGKAAPDFYKAMPPWTPRRPPASTL